MFFSIAAVAVRQNLARHQWAPFDEAKLYIIDATHIAVKARATESANDTGWVPGPQ